MAASKAIVIGGGIAGCSTAHALAQRGLQVTLLERNCHIASAASGNPLAMLYPRLSGNDASSAFALAAFKYSLALYQSLGLSTDAFQPCGMLQLGFNVREEKRIQQVAQQYTGAAGIALVDAQHASAIAHVQLTHAALHFAEAGWVQPQQLCEQLIQHQHIDIKTNT
ncbi:MAG: FAD-dependent oxidoreductase, partial [Methylotenera sp.]